MAVQSHWRARPLSIPLVASSTQTLYFCFVDKTLVIGLAKQAGISEDLFAGWEGHELALYEIPAVGSSASLEAARQIAHEKAKRREWALDLGLRAVTLTREQGAALRQKLDQAGVPYETGPVDLAYLKRLHRVVADHPEVLRELAKR